MLQGRRGRECVERPANLLPVFSELLDKKLQYTSRDARALRSKFVTNVIEVDEAMPKNVSDCYTLNTGPICRIKIQILTSLIAARCRNVIFFKKY